MAGQTPEQDGDGAAKPDVDKPDPQSSPAEADAPDEAELERARREAAAKRAG